VPPSWLSGARPGCYINDRHPSHYHLRRHLRRRYSGDDNLPQSCSDDRCEQYRLTLVNDASTEDPSADTDVRHSSLAVGMPGNVGAPLDCRKTSARTLAGARSRNQRNIFEMSCLSAALMSQYIGHNRRVVRLVVYPLFVDFVAVSVRHCVAQ